MAEDTTGWSEKGKRAKADADKAGGSTTPSRPSKRQDSTNKSSSESKVVRAPAGDAGARKVAKAAATAGQRDVSFASRMGFPALVALICLLGIGVVVYARSTREALAAPVQNLDHWHSVYGVYSCNETGEDKYLPPFQSSRDDAGIHSHGDGVMHIHPFFEINSGADAQVSWFLDELGVEITEEGVTVQNQWDPAVQLATGQECLDGTGIARMVALVWDFDFQALVPVDENRPEPTIYESDFGSIPFDNDRQVFIFAYVSEDTDLSQLPIPPQERFDAVNNASAAIEYEPTLLNPIDTGVDIDSTDGVQVEVDGEAVDVEVVEVDGDE